MSFDIIMSSRLRRESLRAMNRTGRGRRISSEPLPIAKAYHARMSLSVRRSLYTAFSLAMNSVVIMSKAPLRFLGDPSGSAVLSERKFPFLGCSQQGRSAALQSILAV